MKKILLIGLGLLFSHFALAADNVVKEDLTPPPPEGALTINQIPPINSMAKPIAAPNSPSSNSSSPDSSSNLPSSTSMPSSVQAPASPTQ